MAWNYSPYQQNYYQPPQMPTTQPQNNGIIWVQGIEAAKSYLVAPGNTVALWDSETQSIYIKTADMSGMPNLRVLDYTERMTAPKPTEAHGNDYVGREEFNALLERVNAMWQSAGKVADDV